MKIAEIINSKDQLIGQTISIEGLVAEYYLFDDPLHFGMPEQAIGINQSNIALAFPPKNILCFIPSMGFPRTKPRYSRIQIQGELAASSNPKYPIELISALEMQIYTQENYEDFEDKATYKYITSEGVRLEDLPLFQHSRHYPIETVSKAQDIYPDQYIMITGNISASRTGIWMYQPNNAEFGQYIDQTTHPVLEHDRMFGLTVNASHQEHRAFIIANIQNGESAENRISSIQCVVVQKSHFGISYIWACYEKGFEPSWLFRKNLL